MWRLIRKEEVERTIVIERDVKRCNETKVWSMQRIEGQFSGCLTLETLETLRAIVPTYIVLGF